VALIRTDVSEDRIASIFRVHECEQEPHGVISQKMIIIIVTAVETSNLTMSHLFHILPPDGRHVQLTVVL
jgi:hypothetical protein